MLAKIQTYFYNKKSITTNVNISIISGVNICPNDFKIATISTIARSDDPEEELKPAFDLLGPILEKFITISTCYKPSEEIKGTNLWITKTYAS